MRNLMLVTLAIEERETSLDARQSVHCHLIDDPSFCGQGGRFGTPVCDRFVIGGRWSGFLRQTLIGAAYRKRLKRRFPTLEAAAYGRPLHDHEPVTVGSRASDLDALWVKVEGAAPSRFNRDANEEFVHEDDAMPVDGTLYDALLAKHQGESMRQEDPFHCSFVDLDDEEVDESFIGRKWIVVVDYHN